MFPDCCERCGIESDDLNDCKKDEIFHWFICSNCRFALSWKQAAKKHRDRYHTCHDSYMRLSNIYDSAKGFEETATRRLELLRRENEHRVSSNDPCSFCGKYPKLSGNRGSSEYGYVDKHADDCELARELKNE